ncbi:protease inhibitor I42 family protein [Flavobacterium gelatinilyticum]|uniref:protease inhibitor I42 family protein n=1 Tax=Flavobacterium gelatinilyticum TaxID=3003260 RepID=UPI0024815DB3|nr:protease inhibitor I42 family protein [Flavobacterium gelatinilyticum]
MKKLKLVLLFVIIIITALFLISYRGKVYEAGQNDSLRVKAGEEFSIKLYYNPSTGYRLYQINKNPAACVEKVKEAYEAGLQARLGYVGAGGILTLTFKAKTAGIDTLKLKSYPAIEGKLLKNAAIPDSEIDNIFYITAE